MVFLVGSYPFQKIETIREIFVWRMLLVFFSGSLNDCIVFFFDLKNTIRRKTAVLPGLVNDL